jgi:hypothetical protein
VAVTVHLVTTEIFLRVMCTWIYTLVIFVFNRLTVLDFLYVMYNWALCFQGGRFVKA